MCITTSGWRAVGVVSYGYGCGNPDSPGVYSDVSYFNKWISKIANLEKCSNCKGMDMGPECVNTDTVWTSSKDLQMSTLNETGDILFNAGPKDPTYLTSTGSKTSLSTAYVLFIVLFKYAWLTYFL